MYFDYVYNKIKSNNVSHVLSGYNTKDSIRMSLDNELFDTEKIINDFYLLSSLNEELYRIQNIYLNRLSRDAQEITRRCIQAVSNIQAKSNIEDDNIYSDLFEILVDFNWLLASIERKKDDVETINLLINQNDIFKGLGSRLNNLKKELEENKYQYLCIEEARTAKHKIILGRNHFKYRDSINYLNQNVSYSSLEKYSQKYLDLYLKQSAMFYTLLITAILSKEIMRGNNL